MIKLPKFKKKEKKAKKKADKTAELQAELEEQKKREEMGYTREIFAEKLPKNKSISVAYVLAVFVGHTKCYSIFYRTYRGYLSIGNRLHFVAA